MVAPAVDRTKVHAMAQSRTALTDVAQGIYVDTFQLDGRQGPKLPQSGWSVSKRRLRGGMSDNVDVVELDNGLISLSVLPTRGMGIWRGTCAGHELGWKSPVPHPVHPALVDLRERGGLGWLRGFQEFLCRCGLGWNGPPGIDVFTDQSGQRHEAELTLHGRIANTPAHQVTVAVSDEDGGSLAVTGVVDEVMMFAPHLRLTSTLRMRLGEPGFDVIDEVTNVGAQPAEAQLLYHTNIGPPFLEPGSQFVAPVNQLAPRDARAAEGVSHYETYSPPEPGFAEQAYYMQLLTDASGHAEALLKNAAGDLGLSVRFAIAQLPCFTLWKNTQAEQEGYVTGLEPGTNFPNLKSHERQQGRVVPLAPGESFRSELAFAVHLDAVAVKTAEARIAQLQEQQSPRIHSQPQSGFSPMECGGDR